MGLLDYHGSGFFALAETEKRKDEISGFAQIHTFCDSVRFGLLPLFYERV